MTENKHISSQFDAELNNITARVLEMGGLVESQLRHCINVLHKANSEAVHEILDLEIRVNSLEVDIDHLIASTMSRHQPTARDLRFLVGVFRVIQNLERVGDKAARLARTIQLHLNGSASRSLPVHALSKLTQHATDQIHKTLDAFARYDVQACLEVIDEDERIDTEYEGLLRQLITHMMEDPRTISDSINLLFLAKAVERIGDHATNIAEATIYVVKGADLRHATPEQRESVLR